MEWMKVARKLVDDGIRTVELFGGDVFLRKDVVIDLCRLLKASGCQVHIPTNANLVDEEIVDKLSPTVQAMYISIDGPGELQDRVRGVEGSSRRTLNALNLFRKARGCQPTPRLICNTTVSRYNYDKLLQIGEQAVGAGFDEIHYEYVGQFTPEHVRRSAVAGQVPSPIYIQTGDESCLIEPAMAEGLRNQLKAARELGARFTVSGQRFNVVTINIDTISDRNLVEGTVPPRRCFMEKTSIVIDPCGNIVPCLFFDNSSLGNIRQGALDASLEVQERLEFRKAHKNGKIELCNHCIMSVIRNRTGCDTIKRAALSGLNRRP